MCINFINRCLVSNNAVVSFVARHGVFHSRMFSCIGRNFQFCCNRYTCRLRACDLVNRAHYKRVIDKASTDRLDHSVQCCADLIRELVMVREGLLVLSDSRISKDDILCGHRTSVRYYSDVVTVLCFFAFFFCFFCFSFVFILIMYFVYDIDNNNNNNNNNSTDRVRLTCMVCTNKIDNWLLARY